MTKQNNIDAKLDKILLGIEQLIVILSTKFTEYDQRWDENDRMHRRTHERIDRLDDRIGNVETKVDRLDMKVDRNLTDQQILNAQNDVRVTNLETWRNSYNK